MTYNKKSESTVVIRVFCAIAFFGFTFCYMYFYQCDLIGAMQHVLSCGQTSYSRPVGAVIVTLLLYLLQIGVYSITKQNRHAHALTYFPSLMLLCLLTGVEDTFDKHFALSTWTWLSPILIVMFALTVYLLMKYKPYMSDKSGSGLFSEASWVNMLLMALMFFSVGIFSNGNDVLHYRMKIERFMNEGKYAEALDVGKSSLETDSSLVMLRANVLARSGLLGERLFEYPLIGGSASLLPNGGSVRCVRYDSGNIYRVAGAVPKTKMTVEDYLKTIKMTGQTKAGYADYLLCSYLLDKKLDRFAGELGNYYKMDSTSVLPKHYREALVIYEHKHSTNIDGFHDDVCKADYEDFIAMRKKYLHKKECRTILRDIYGKTYWYYYLYM
ncbi:DUF6057 family protein [Prevotella sp. OH937_COT-195]|uniref:DUF6057 family protein n=1 Tax=Prevotella sp. OH937_COT-195 TaxID=2491051 RepID=UPI000F64EE30|nr:DUF6057 family protein [Prevotella sp. OH937_COT-195]RRD02224.1 hypothetical protein EII32_04065 [Prevotella sp. OH937_COT-195]